MFIRQLFDSDTWTYTYLVADLEAGRAVLIDPVASKLERDLQQLRELGCELVYSLDTHVHADHITAGGQLRDRTGCRCIGSKNGAACVDTQASQGDRFEVGNFAIEVLETPGHTDDSLTFKIGDNVFTGDALLIRGCGRTDFQNGDAGTLYESLTQKLFSLPDKTTVWPGHDYRGLTSSTIGEEKKFNPRIAGKSREEFIEVMRQLKLPRPKYIDIAVPANRVCGRMDGPTKAPGVDVAEVLDSPRHQWPRIVDVRREDEWNNDHLEGIEHVPLDQLEQIADGWPRDEPIYFLCRSGNRSGQAALKLKNMGFTAAVNLEGGMLRVREKFLPGEV